MVILDHQKTEMNSCEAALRESIGLRNGRDTPSSGEQWVCAGVVIRYASCGRYSIHVRYASLRGATQPARCASVEVARLRATLDRERLEGVGEDVRDALRAALEHAANDEGR